MLLACLRTHDCDTHQDCLPDWVSGNSKTCALSRLWLLRYNLLNYSVYALKTLHTLPFFHRWMLSTQRSIVRCSFKVNVVSFSTASSLRPLCALDTLPVSISNLGYEGKFVAVKICVPRSIHDHKSSSQVTHWRASYIKTFWPFGTETMRLQKVSQVFLADIRVDSITILRRKSLKLFGEIFGQSIANPLLKALVLKTLRGEC